MVNGLKDWLIQRVSAVIMAIYVIGMAVFFLNHPHVSFVEWRMLFTHTGMKIATLLFFSALLLHAWVGMWTVFTDYIKSSCLRFSLHLLVFLTLMACFFWAWLILWGI